MSCKIDTRINHATDVADLVNVELVPLSCKLSESDKLQAKTFAVLLAQMGTEFIRVSNGLNAMIPSNAVMVRDERSQLVGINTVTGG